ncbi:SDR family oxidoreductase [Paenibacillus sacheonensis]|uniref:NAD(P)H-binding protein n=1 Tax=Paenibacillus sacheonensis TaxID=742054 RepID=A0A7X4YRR0_9BACL|nr:NAD(P)H-binding protein [Paenibacillus sacheonensis]MBM7566224.1 uncharacterized protein YbjT (DUF2867 family) [Paenibacillus sacheonensis]NBC70431.1 NAD(P)H-binding protein [Paenibacillus sacheonensis]
MIIAIVGGNGTLGRHVVAELRRRGHETRSLSRSSTKHRIDLTTGEGLPAALAGCDAVVDASNATTNSSKVLVEGSRRLLAAEAEAGVRHHVGVSIVGCELVPFGYYRVKAEQERIVEGGPVPWSIVRSTQFHEFVSGLLKQAGRWRMLPLPIGKIPLQTVACADVAAAIADVVESTPARRRIEIAGPEIIDAGQWIRAWRSIAGKRALLLPVPLPRRVSRSLSAGALISHQPDYRGRIRFRQWLQDELNGRKN